MCVFLQSTISISSASGRIVYGGNNHANKSCLPSRTWKEDVENVCDVVHVGEMETKRVKKTCESHSVVIRRKDRGACCRFSSICFYAHFE